MTITRPLLGTVVVTGLLAASGSAMLESWPSIAASPTAASADATIVAESDLGQITYRKIRCGPRAPVEKCRDIEQENLRVRLSQLIIFAAAGTYGVELSDAERREVDGLVAAQRENIANAARVFRAAIAGAARVHAGEPLDHVAATQGVSVEMIEQAMNEYPTESEARTTLTRDFVNEIEAAGRKTYTRERLAAKLRTLIHERATQRHVTDEEESKTFWNGVAVQRHFRVLDSRYKLPDFKGVLNVQEISIAISH
jgi:hypothetical protein